MTDDTMPPLRYQAKKTIVVALEDICERTGHHWCHRLAMWSYKLDVRWGLGVWSTVEAEDEKQQ